jgi:hypothetical protein
VNGKSYTQPITVKQDPRVKTSSLVMQQIYSQSAAMYWGAVNAQTATAQLAAIRDQVAKLQSQATGAAAGALAAFDKNAAALALPAAVASLGGMMNLLQAADVQPTAIQLAAIAGARQTAAGTMARWTTLKTVDLVALNVALKAAGLPVVTVQ